MIHWGLKTRTIGLCKKLNSIYVVFYLWSAARSNCPELVHTTAGVWCIFFLLYGITTTYLSNGPLTLLIEIVDRSIQFLAQTDRFVSKDLNVLSRAAGFNLVLSVYVFFFSQSREYHWLTLYDWQTAAVWVKNLLLCSTEETKSPTSWMPLG